MMYNKKAFTLVELIVVITILAILGTIAFVSLQGYSKDARNSARIADSNSVESALELYVLQTGTYPIPGNASDVTASGGTVVLWKSGIIDEGVFTKIGRLSHLPLDPKTGENIKYSTILNQKEYQIKYDLEFAQKSTNISTSYAGNNTSFIKGPYNELYLVASDNTYYSVPSLHTYSGIGVVDTEVEFSFNGKNVKFTVAPLKDNGTLLTPVNLKDKYDKFAIALKKSYDNVPDLSSEGVYAEVKKLDVSDIESMKVFAQNITSKKKKTNKKNSAIPIITQVLCEGAGWTWVEGSMDVLIGTSRGKGFCISPLIGDSSDNAGYGMSWNGWGNNTDATLGGWDASGVTDSGNTSYSYGQTRNLDSLVSYSCKPLGTAISDFDTEDTIEGRMKWLTLNANNRTEFINIDWLENVTPASGFSQSIGVLYIADCIDGKKDLTTDMIYTHKDNSTDEVTYLEFNTDKTAVDQSSTYAGCNSISLSLADNDCEIFQNRQKYLVAWTQKSGSHLPSAFASITNGFSSANDPDGNFISGDDSGEYQVACEGGKLGAVTWNGFKFVGGEDDIADESIWTAAIGDPDGSKWGQRARTTGNIGCSGYTGMSTASRAGTNSARFVIRP